MQTKNNAPTIFANTPYLTGVDIQLSELLGYKQHANLRLQPSATAAYRPMAGNYLAKIKGRGMEFAEVRHYQAGDDVRTIDWAVTARTGKAHTKLFQEEKERPVFILLDLSDSMIFGSQFVFKSVQAVHLAALISWQAKQRNDRLGGIIFNQHHVVELKPSARNKGLLSYLYQAEKLCVSSPFNRNNKKDTREAVKAAQSETFVTQLKRLSRLAQTGCQIHLISDFSQVDNDCIKLINRLKKHNQISAWQINDPLESALPKKSTRGRIQINTLTGSGFIQAKEAYQTEANARQQKITDCFTKQGVALHQVCASKSLMEQFYAPKY